MPSLSPTSLHVPPPTPMTNARVSMFEGATNTNIINSHFTITNGNGQQIGHSRGLEMLLEHCCLGARLDSNERFDPPRCAEDTRVAITQHIMDWIASADDDGASMLVLHGSAGAGKSALEQSISERCQREGYLGAAFFLSRTATSAQRSNGDTVIPTIVYQLIQIFPWLRHLVLREIEDDPSIFQLSRAGIMHRLFIKYFKDHFAQFPGDTYKRPCLIAIDGLDECSDCDVQCDLLKIIASAVHDVPYPFRFFVACRPESHLMAALSRELS
ncbi:hypothetical protein NLJ89_g11369 [Agrocybe chaxingu]|uniref:Nephrocystin 3-like N-terminal domain-containing protein n=1 Tax=Agrocybe chaxingu TaxID=84603 RepID=A0A9W8JQ28_9AGAR|nr:hypothetical protein NLJ89_g11369 [Agrocybe chaxingu]